MAPRRRDYVPPLRFHWLTPVYDGLIALFMRGKRWRPAMIAAARLHASDVVLDIGCGTGTLLIEIKSHEPDLRAIGLDPDAGALAIARAKAARAHADISFFQAMGAEWPAEVAGAGVTKVVTSLVLHQVPLDGKAAILKNAFRHLAPSGTLTIVDYGVQTGLARALFLMTQMLDGFAATGANARGCVPVLMEEAGFCQVREHWRLFTVGGSLSMYTGVKSG